MGDYFGLNPIVSLILLIIPFTAWFCGILTRFKDGHYVAGIIRIFFGAWLIWIVEIILTILNGCNVKVWRLLSV